ncbi:MAG: hypothetical protein HY675_00510 [Chloroflexi bacterium]|nr:hypothetical protein [Chloroflexota bacterium]
MVEGIEFMKREKIDPATNKRYDEVVVLREGQEVAALPEADRLERAQALPLEEARWIATHFDEIMGREPTPDEREFWRAITDYKLHLRTLVIEEAPCDEKGD